MDYIHRLLEDTLKKTVRTRPLLYLNGSRQCGKSTLVQNISVGKNLNYITFDNPVHLFFARNDPAGFLQQLPNNRLNVMDEVQLAPELFRNLKIIVDEKRLTDKSRALYVLTGSANIFALPKLADALVGRLSILTLYPFSASEIKGTGVNVIKKLWNDDLYPRKYSRANIVSIISNATFPEIALDKRKNRYLWFNDYITTLLQRDVRTLADIKNPDKIYQLLVSLSQRAGGLLNNANIMKETGLDAKTYEKYKALCDNTFLTFELPSWTKPNRLNKKFVKQKKLYFTDTSLLCHIMQRDMDDVYKNDKTTMGHIFENFIATEIMKAAKSLDSYSVSHFNPVQNQGKEVDFVIESPNGKTVGVEVKLDSTINEKDWANMNTLQETIGNRFMKGIIIYTGSDLVQVSRKIWAVPVQYLWMQE
ncbi:MAG: ATP-binding protein [Treponema sp.]|jgi:predicted AAA+ superfamily ATPase|nr:ATP-binding protein [Treponema sp.]